MNGDPSDKFRCEGCRGAGLGYDMGGRDQFPFSEGVIKSLKAARFPMANNIRAALARTLIHEGGWKGRSDEESVWAFAIRCINAQEQHVEDEIESRGKHHSFVAALQKKVDSSLRGSVVDAARSLWEKTCSAGPVRGSVLNCLLTGAGPAPADITERRKLDGYEEVGRSAAAEGAQSYVDVVSRRKEKVTRPTTKGGEDTGVTVETRVRKGNLLKRARIVATRTCHDFRRVLGFISGGSRNRAWTTALCGQYSKLLTQELSGHWTSQLRARGDSKDVAEAEVRTLLLSIELWRRDEVSQETEEGKEVVPDMMTESQCSDIFVSGLFSSQLGAPLVKKNRVCPYCLYFEMSHHHNIELPVNGQQSGLDSWEAILDSISNSVNAGHLLAMALLHNKEMHSQNGNIMGKIWDESNPSRDAGIGRNLHLGWDVEVIRGIIRETADEALTEAEKYLPFTNYSDGDYGGRRSYTSGGTLHQECSGRIRANWSAARTSVSTVAGKGKVGGKLQAKGVSKGPVVVEDGGGPSTSGTPGASDDGAGSSDSGGVFESPAGKTRSGRKYAPPEHRTPAGSAPEQLCSNLLWSAVGLDRDKKHGKIVLTDIGDAMMRSLKDPEDKSGMININRSRTIFNYVVGGGALSQSVSLGSASDWRELGLKASLYEDMRERRFTQPSGYDFAVAKRLEPDVEVVPVTGDPDWGYSAVCVSWRYLDKFLQSSGRIPVGLNGEELWDINSNDVQVVTINDNSNTVGCGLDIWILSHLDYPLVHILETFNMVSVGDGNNLVSSHVPFVRTSSLVDIHSSARRVIFVTCSDTFSDVTLGGVEFPVPSLDRHGHLGVGGGPPIRAFDDGISFLLERVLNTTECLRSAFDEYASTYFAGSLDWMEVDNLACILKVRWHPKVGVKVRPDGSGAMRRTYHHIDANTARYLGLGNPETALQEYGGKDAVTTLDQVLGPRKTARRYPHLRIGKWDAIAELGVASGLALYQAFDTENDAAMRSRMEAGGQDSLIRCGYWRLAMELWKRQNGLRDEICAPMSYGDMGNYWVTFVEMKSMGGMTLGNVASLLCRSKYVVWGWRLNDQRAVNPSQTGIRTPSLWWANPLNTEWEPFDMGGGRNHSSNSYRVNTNRTEWSRDYWVPHDKGEDDYQLESIISRFNMEHSLQGIDYMALPSRGQASGYGYNLESFTSTVVAREAGWRDKFEHLRGDLMNKKWGWGIGVLIRDWVNDSLKKIVIKGNAMDLASTNHFNDRIQLFRGPDSLPPSGTNRDYLYRLPTTDRDAVLAGFRAGASPADGGGSAQKGSFTPRTEGSSTKDGKVGGDPVPPKGSISRTKTEVAPVKTIEKISGANREKEKLDGKPTATTPPLPTMPKVGSVTEEKATTSASSTAKLGTTEEKAKVNPDHQKRTDVT